MGDDEPEVTGTAGRPSWLEPWFGWLDEMLHREVLRLRTRYEFSIDEPHGRFVSDEYVDALLVSHGGLAMPDSNARDPVPDLLADRSPLTRVCTEFGLAASEGVALVVAAAPDVDLKYRPIFAYLNDDLTRPLPTIDLCLRLAGEGAALLDARSPVFDAGLLNVLPAPGAAHWRASGLVLANAVRELLLDVGAPSVPKPDLAFDSAEFRQLARSIRAGRLRLIAVDAAVPADAQAAARDVVSAARRGLIEITTPAEVADALLRARVNGACLVLPLLEPAEMRPIFESSVVALVTVPHGDNWQRHVDGIDHAVLCVPAPPPDRRAELWREKLRGHGLDIDHREVDSVASLFALGPSQIGNAAAAAGRDGVYPLAAHARAQCVARLPALAQPVELGYRWGDLVLPDPTLRRLRELASAIRYRNQVFDGWGFRRLSAGAGGIRAILCGASGTGKTMSAAVVAADLGLPLCRVDLSAVVSKYIGETEKNLEAIFRAAEAANAVLMFDEADALFGKRSEVSDAHDRYANIEIAYLLQRVESFEGALLLATNLAGNLDEAFARRIQVAIEFPMPDLDARARLWRQALPSAAPTLNDLDIDFLAQMFALSGGEIRNAALGAAFLAAHDQSPIGMEHVVRAVARHRLRQGKLPTAAEFQGYLQLAHTEGR
jgi:hypothetical protein